MELSSVFHWLANHASGFVTAAANMLAQSTLVIVAGLLCARVAAHKGAAVQSAVLRATLLAVIACPAAAWFLAQAGISGWRVQLPDKTRVDNAPSREIAAPQIAASAQTFPHAIPTVSSAMPSAISTTAAAIAPTAHQSPHAPYVEAFPTDTHLAPPTLPASSPQKSNPIYPILAAIWLGISGLLLIRILVATFFLRSARRSARPAPQHVIESCRLAADAMHLTPPPVLVSDRITSPCLVGCRKPVILLPAGAADFSHDVLLHELAHLRRRDCAWLLLARLVSAIWWFQPLVWLLLRGLDSTADDVCDDAVVAHPADRAAYAHRLVDLAERHQWSWPSTAAAAVGVVSLRSAVAQRVIRIMDTSRNLSTRIRRRTLALIVAIGLGGTVLAAMLGIGREGAFVVQASRLPAAETAAPQGTDKIPQLIEKLKSPDRNVREAACHELAELGIQGEAAVAHLTKVLTDDPITSVRSAAAKALGKIGPAASSAVPQLIAALEQDGSELNSEAARALGLIGDPAAVPPLVAAMTAALDVVHARSKTRYRGTPMALAEALGKLGRKDTAAVEPLIAALNSKQYQIRTAAAKALGEMAPRDPEAVRGLIRVLEDRDHLSLLPGKIAAATALGAIGDPAALPALKREVQLGTFPSTTAVPLYEAAVEAVARISAATTRATGRVLDEPGGKTVAEGMVRIRSTTTGRDSTTRIDQDGNYSFDQVAPDVYTLNIVSQPFGVWSEHVEIRVADQNARAPDLHLRLPQSVSGVVRDVETGEPAASARINASVGSVVTDNRGQYRLYVKPQTIELECDGTFDRFLPVTRKQRIDVAAGQHAKVDFKVRSAPPFSGQVLLPDGKPAAGIPVLAKVQWGFGTVKDAHRVSEAKARRDARIKAGLEVEPAAEPPGDVISRTELGTGSDFRLTTDDEGRFHGYLRRLDGLKRDELVDIIILAPLPDGSAGAMAVVNTTTLDPPPAPIEVRLKPTATASFQIADPQGRPVTGAKITAGTELFGYMTMRTPAGVLPTITEVGDGKYKASGLVAGWGYSFFAEAAGYRRRNRLITTAEPGATLDLGTLALNWWGEKAVPELIEKLKSPDRYARESACYELGQLGPEAHAAVAPLTKILTDDPINSARFAAAEALGKIGPAARSAVPQLIHALEHESLGVDREAARALGRIGDPAAIAPLATALRAPVDDSRLRDPDVARALVESLGSFGRTNPTAILPLIDALKSKYYCAAAAEALGQIGPAAKAAVPDLIRAVEDIGPGSPSTSRTAAATALGAIGDPAALPALQRASQNQDDSSLFKAAAEAITRLTAAGPGASAEPAKTPLVSDKAGGNN